MDTSSLIEAREESRATTPTTGAMAVGQLSLWLRSRTRLLAALAVSALALAAAWLWFGAEAVRPLLYLLPCAVMMAVCMKGHGTDTTPSNTGTTP
jgi:hypothetical protein